MTTYSSTRHPSTDIRRSFHAPSSSALVYLVRRSCAPVVTRQDPAPVVVLFDGVFTFGQSSLGGRTHAVPPQNVPDLGGRPSLLAPPSLAPLCRLFTRLLDCIRDLIASNRGSHPRRRSRLRLMCSSYYVRFLDRNPSLYSAAVACAGLNLI